MLQSLFINNIALITHCKLELGEGLNILTGETGAGKSIIIDSLNFVLGAKADKSLIRYGEDKAVVEAVFYTENPSVFANMEEIGLEVDNTIIIRRTMSEHRNEIRINGQVVTLSMLKKFTADLVDILGQHEHHSLLKNSTHLDLLDKYGEEKVAKQKEELSSLVKEYRRLQKALSSYGDERERARKIDSLSYMVAEIQKANLQEGEEEELLAQREKFRNAEKIVTGASNAYSMLDGEDISVLSIISDALSSLNSVSSYDSTLEELRDRIESSKIELKDIADTLSSYCESFDFDGRTASRVENRVDLIRTLKRKYGNSISEILALCEKSSEELDILNNADAEISKIKKELDNLTLTLYNKAKTLSTTRRKIAEDFENAILKELSDLAMKNTCFKVAFQDIPPIEEMDTYLSEKGFDNVEFVISPNLGEPLRPLAKIASGGEMSRFMLALKNITASLDGIDTMVFDEIDTGISGNVAYTVAQKMCNISVNRQVIAVTHLPQLAGYADKQYLIEKKVEGDKTVTMVNLLDYNQRVCELVRLTGGSEGSQIGEEHAKELLTRAKKFKDSL